MNDTGPKSTTKKPVMTDVQRTGYMLDHFSHKAGAIGRLQTLSEIPILAGDSMNVRGRFVIRLSPLRQNLYLDARVDLFAFYVPHRHVYATNAVGSRWNDFLLAGVDEGITLGTTTLAANTENYNCFGFFMRQGQVQPKWACYPYMQIFRNYFKDPTDTTAYADTFFEGTPTADDARFGLACCHLKRIWNAAPLVTTTSADYSLPLSGGEVNLYELTALQGRLKTETERDWYDVRYRDLLQNKWDSRVNIDADQRPELIMHSSAWLSGRDIEGTDDATLGTWAGKSVGVFELSFPTKFFPEHGTLWLMALVRFPAIPYNEMNYLISKDEPTYSQISGDPDIVRRTAPIDLNLNEIIVDGPSVVVGKIPYAQWYREQPSVLHEMYQEIEGHPFYNLASVSTRNGSIYIDSSQYDTTFKSLQLKHWSSQGFIEVDAYRFIPDVNDSIYAGTD